MNDFFDIHKAKLAQFNAQFRKRTQFESKIEIPADLFVKCDKCLEPILHEELIRNSYVCPSCQHYFTIGARERIKMMTDNARFDELDSEMKAQNPLNFPEYEQKVRASCDKSKEQEAFVSGCAEMDGIRIAIGALDPRFMMGSMGSVVGEKVTRLVEYATANSYPLVIFSASGGARMQEGIFSLMQMAKTAGALKRHHDASLLYISVLTNPTTGGVAASFASLGDINIAESGALIGFAGPRVIKQTIRQDLPEGFQTSEFQLKHGMVDLVTDRKELKKTIISLLKFHQKGGDTFGK
ncbi:MAG: acetyl-CoA carboxylase, carboxyltransferase subunit beta [Candidatus Izemoplasmatales bacterium]|jgi:acetyl-CoA carboxylase carboxyl transferase subunit beta|nr:acetyl-CoA carboxylase, carboxyltransferase subunit beta [bacterium]MDZ4196981.1 acetyl-CoA carboxylase, carboxyltransferase subunit beta [Candidatus Izemoplasmatales bacterium]